MPQSGVIRGGNNSRGNVELEKIFFFSERAGASEPSPTVVTRTATSIGIIYHFPCNLSKCGEKRPVIERH